MPLDVRPLDSFPAFHGTRRFNTEFTIALHLFLSWARPIQSTSPHPISPRSILILSTHLRFGLLSGLFPSGFPTNNLYVFLFSYIRATWPTRLILILVFVLLRPPSVSSVPRFGASDVPSYVQSPTDIHFVHACLFMWIFWRWLRG
jgi:hypothetical protein